LAIHSDVSRDGESFPANIVFAIERRVVDEVEVVARYTIEHADWV
jgi:hypothetical protein